MVGQGRGATLADAKRPPRQRLLLALAMPTLTLGGVVALDWSILDVGLGYWGGLLGLLLAAVVLSIRQGQARAGGFFVLHGGIFLGAVLVMVVVWMGTPSSLGDLTFAHAALVTGIPAAMVLSTELVRTFSRRGPDKSGDDGHAIGRYYGRMLLMMAALVLANQSILPWPGPAGRALILLSLSDVALEFVLVRNLRRDRFGGHVLALGRKPKTAYELRDGGVVIDPGYGPRWPPVFVSFAELTEVRAYPSAQEAQGAVASNWNEWTAILQRQAKDFIAYSGGRGPRPSTFTIGEEGPAVVLRGPTLLYLLVFPHQETQPLVDAFQRRGRAPPAAATGWIRVR